VIPHFLPFSERLGRRLLVWALVALLPVQTIAAGALATIGPLHTHRAISTVAVLEDVRRVAAPARRLPQHVATLLGHFHAGVGERHHHASGDASVVADDGGAAALDGDGCAVAAWGASAAPPTTPAAWHGEDCVAVRVARAAWVPRSRDPDPCERRPRLV
jgi:hypothetical protein